MSWIVDASGCLRWFSPETIARWAAWRVRYPHWVQPVRRAAKSAIACGKAAGLSLPLAVVPVLIAPRPAPAPAPGSYGPMWAGEGYAPGGGYGPLLGTALTEGFGGIGGGFPITGGPFGFAPYPPGLPPILAQLPVPLPGSAPAPTAPGLPGGVPPAIIPPTRPGPAPGIAPPLPVTPPAPTDVPEASSLAVFLAALAALLLVNRVNRNALNEAYRNGVLINMITRRRA